jgi:hypothetical protein
MLIKSNNMKRTLIAAVLLTGLLAAQAQERLSREEALKYAFFTSVDLKEMLLTPIPTDPDVKRPVAMRDDEQHGGMILPEAKLSADTFAKAGKEVASVGQLWLVKLAPMNEGEVVSKAKLRTVHVRAGDQEADVACCALGVCKDASRGLELLIYGKDKEPLTRVPMKSISSQQDNPIEMSSERKDDRGLVTLRFLGKYEVTFAVTDPEQY